MGVTGIALLGGHDDCFFSKALMTFLEARMSFLWEQAWPFWKRDDCTNGTAFFGMELHFLVRNRNDLFWNVIAFFRKHE